VTHVDGQHVEGVTEHVARKLAKYGTFDTNVPWTVFVGQARCAVSAVREFDLNYRCKHQFRQPELPPIRCSERAEKVSS
jgi:hypothetical protein